jgi:hypothetical protein
MNRGLQNCQKQPFKPPFFSYVSAEPGPIDPRLRQPSLLFTPRYPVFYLLYGVGIDPIQTPNRGQSLPISDAVIGWPVRGRSGRRETRGIYSGGQAEPKTPEVYCHARLRPLLSLFCLDMPQSAVKTLEV